MLLAAMGMAMHPQSLLPNEDVILNPERRPLRGIKPPTNQRQRRKLARQIGRKVK